MPNQPTPPDGPPYIPGIAIHLGERYDSDDMYRDYPDLTGTVIDGLISTKVICGLCGAEWQDNHQCHA